MSWWPFSSSSTEAKDGAGHAVINEAPDAPIDSTTATTNGAASTHRRIDPTPALQAEQVNSEATRRHAHGNESMAQTWATLLEPFSKGHELPARARTDPHIPQREQEPMTLSKLWQYLPFLAVQGTALTKAFINHHIYGPPKPSWGVELTLFTALLREVAAYSHLSSLARLRSVVNLAPLLPTPKDGIVTPISFRVKRRNLRGFLAEADAAEDGKRMITGEWVINKRLWRRMQTEYSVKKSVAQDARVILYLHGGAYYIMSAESHRFLTISCSRYLESRVFAINYRLAPETRFPGQLHDAVSAYMRLIIDLKIPPENIIVIGDSAGGGLSLALMMYLRDEGYPLPSGGILMSPWVDLTMSCESWTTNRSFDYLPSPKTDDPLNPVKCLLGSEGILKYLTHPYVSPLFGDFSRLPPLLIQAGDAEVLRDEITLLAHKASLAGVSVEHEIFEDCVHVFQAFLFLEASRKALQSQRHFVKQKLPLLQKAKDVDFGQIDRDIVADAHPVDERGHADATSLPSSPRPSKHSELHPAPGEQAEDPSDSDSDELSGESTPAELASPSTEEGASHSHQIAANQPVTNGSGITNVRPLLRAFASARDLGMSTANNEDGMKARLRTSSNLSMSSREEPTSLRSLHARSSSHPDLRQLLEDYETMGPKHITRVWSSTSGHATPPNALPSSKPPSIDEEKLIASLEAERQRLITASRAVPPTPSNEASSALSARARAPSFLGDNPGFDSFS